MNLEENNCLKNTKFGVIGVGTIGSTLIKGMLNNNLVPPEKIIGSTSHKKSAGKAGERLGIRTTTDNLKVATQSDVLLLAVKPQVMSSVLKQIGTDLSRDQLCISVAAAIPTSYIEKYCEENVPVIRAMPNTPAKVKAGMTVMCPGKYSKEAHLNLAARIFSPVSKVEILKEEKLMDAITGLSGSGPAYGYLIIEALTEAGVKVGLPRDLATTLAAQSLFGAARMVLETKEHPAKLKDMVTTPAGVTVDGIMKLEEGGVRVSLIKAVVEATNKSGELNID